MHHFEAEVPGGDGVARNSADASEQSAVSSKMDECRAALSEFGSFTPPATGEPGDLGFFPFQMFLIVRYMMLWLSENPDASTQQITEAETDFIDTISKQDDLIFGNGDIGIARRIAMRVAGGVDTVLWEALKKKVTGDEELSSAAFVAFLANEGAEAKH